MTSTHLHPYPTYRDSGIEWLEQIPAHWDVKRLKTFSRIRYGLGQPPRESSEGLPLIRATNVIRGRITEEDMVWVDPDDVPTGRDALLAEGEIIVVRSGAYTADSAIIPKSYEGSVAGYDMVVTVNGALAEFVAVALLCNYVTDGQLVIYSLRSAQPHLNAEELGAAVILLPPLPEQRAIAAFLDRETARIDALVAKKERLVELLQEKRTALITHAVTRGLDPYVPSKDSGVKWLGEIPAHWEVLRLKHASRIQGGFAFSTQSFRAEGIAVIRMNNICRGILDLHGVVRVSEKDCVDACALSEGDIIYGLSGSIGSTGSLGNYAVVRECDLPAQLNQRVARFRPKARKMVDNFLVASVQASAFYRQVLSFTTGTAQFNVSTNDIGNVILALPPLREQGAIAAFLDRETAKIDALVRKVREATDRLKELRQALISAAVTGKIDVRNDLADSLP